MIRITLPELKRIEAIAQSTPGCISFSQGALRVGGISQKVKEHVQGLLNSDITDYYRPGTGIMELREKLAQVLSAQHNVSLTTQNVIVTHGGIGAITTVFMTVLKEGDEVIIPEPTYPPYKNIATLSKAVPVLVPAYKAVTDDNGMLKWTFDVESIKAAITPKTKILVLANPSNPTGMSLDEKTLLELIDLCEEKGIYFISDEVYDNFVFEGKIFSATPYVAQRKFLIRVGSFSKSLGMSGWRVGYLVANADLISHCAGVQDALIVCPSVIGQHGVLFALDHPEILKEHYADVLKSRDIICEMLRPLAEKGIFNYEVPKASFYLFLKTQYEDSTELAVALLEKSKVALVPGKDFGPSGKSYMRLCFARTPNVVQEGVERIIKFFLLRC